MSFNTNTENNETWLTPPALIQQLGVFDLDPCAAIGQPWVTAMKHYTLNDGDGLALPWEGRVWCNPPYSKKTWDWMQKLSDHEGGGMGLIFARTDTKGFHEYVFNRAAGGLFLEGRIHFHKIDGSRGKAPNAASILVAYSEQDYQVLIECSVKGKRVRFNTTTN